MSREYEEVPVTVELDAHFAQYVDGQLAPGLVYGIIDDTGLVHARGFGTSWVGGPSLTADTVFPLASMSKSFLASAVLTARDRGHISLDDPISRFVPEFSSRMSDGEPTVGMLLSMSGGLTEDNAWIDPLIGRPRRELLADVAGGVRLSRQPGTAFEYSNLGYALVGIAVERATETPLADLLERDVFEPLGLTSTFVDSRVPADCVRAVGHRLDVHGRWTPLAPAMSDAYLGAAGIVSNVRDIARWVTWLGAALRDPADTAGVGPAHNDDSEHCHSPGIGVLSAASRRELQRIHMPFVPDLPVDGAQKNSVGGYGLGLEVTLDPRRGTIVSHPGGLPGFLLHMGWHPASGHGVVVLTNSHRGDPHHLASAAIDRLLDRFNPPSATVTLWPETLDVRRRVERLVYRWDDVEAAELFAANMDFDRSVELRRADIGRLLAQVGPLGETGDGFDLVAAPTPAEVTWAIPAARGELLCRIHLTPCGPARVQEFDIAAHPYAVPRSARPAGFAEGQVVPATVGARNNIRIRR